MSDTSVFSDKDMRPSDQELSEALGRTYSYWQNIIKYALATSPGATEEWNYSKQGWNCRIKGKKSAIIYLMPQDGQFKAGFVLGVGATNKALAADVSTAVKETVSSAKVYAEGRGFRLNVRSKKDAADILKLIDIKLAQ